jgi:hypothetical protein
MITFEECILIQAELVNLSFCRMLHDNSLEEQIFIVLEENGFLFINFFCVDSLLNSKEKCQ